MKSAIPSDLLKLQKRFEAWRKTRAKRSKTPDRLLKVAAALLDHYSASMVCRVCGINLLTLRRRTSSKVALRRSATPPLRHVRLEVMRRMVPQATWIRRGSPHQCPSIPCLGVSGIAIAVAPRADIGK